MPFIAKHIRSKNPYPVDFAPNAVRNLYRSSMQMLDSITPQFIYSNAALLDRGIVTLGSSFLATQGVSTDNHLYATIGFVSLAAAGITITHAMMRNGYNVSKTAQTIIGEKAAKKWLGDGTMARINGTARLGTNALFIAEGVMHKNPFNVAAGIAYVCGFFPAMVKGVGENEYDVEIKHSIRRQNRLGAWAQNNGLGELVEAAQSIVDYAKRRPQEFSAVVGTIGASFLATQAVVSHYMDGENQAGMFATVACYYMAKPFARWAGKNRGLMFDSHAEAEEVRREIPPDQMRTP